MKGGLLATVIVACGARTGLGGGDGNGGVAWLPHPLCESASGVRLCGGSPPCPEIPAPECRGYACEHGADVVTSAPASGGACLSDTPGDASSLCHACPDGDACLLRPTGDLVCVPADVCHALWDIGVRDVCRYADKSAYDDRPLAEGGKCPWSLGDPMRWALCGGGCGACQEPTWSCTGRSATRGWGICQTSTFKPTIPSCSLTPSGSVVRWCDTQFPDGWACGVYRNAPTDVAASRLYGTCLGPALCVRLRGILGLDCYDASGVLIQ